MIYSYGLKILVIPPELKRKIGSFSQEDRQYDYENYLVGLNEGVIQFDVLGLSFLVHLFKDHGVDTKLLELHIDINASKLKEFNGFKVPESDQHFYVREIKKVIKRHTDVL